MDMPAESYGGRPFMSVRNKNGPQKDNFLSQENLSKLSERNDDDQAKSICTAARSAIKLSVRSRASHKSSMVTMSVFDKNKKAFIEYPNHFKNQ